ncbi:hypothetical protein ACFL1H_01875 [Nanoarchaeota archaeon]
MSVDDIICPECQSDDITKEKDRNLLNLAFGISIFTAIGAGTDCYGLAGVGVVWYFFDIPFGPKIEYNCNKCDYDWDD